MSQKSNIFTDMIAIEFVEWLIIVMIMMKQLYYQTGPLKIIITLLY
jgi:hypothetical protein